MSPPYAIMVTEYRRDVVALQTTNTKALLKQYIERHYIEEPLFVDTILRSTFDQIEMDIPTTTPFSTYLFALMDQRNLEDVTVYKRAQIDRRVFSKIRSNIDYQPSKKTAFKLLLALKLTYQEAKEFLEYAGFSFSRSSKFDLIVEFCVKHEHYDIDYVNTLLYDYVEETL